LFQFSRLHSSPRENTILQNRLLCVTARCSSSADFTPLHARIIHRRTGLLALLVVPVQQTSLLSTREYLPRTDCPDR
ncbi:hypothetical protein J6590_046362, partial [Homalodisca vitripennis]